MDRRLLLAFVVIPAAVSLTACEPQALAISANIEARHRPFGTLLDPIFASPVSDEISGYTRCGDSALWTGHDLAAEAIRYRVTNAPAAMKNSRQALAGLEMLVDVTGTDLLARCAVPMSSPFAAGITREEAHNGIYAGGQNFWVGNTSRDQYSGAFFGLAVAYDMLGDAALRSSIAALATRMLNFLLDHNWVVVMPDGKASTTFVLRPDQQLTLLAIGRHVNPAAFESKYSGFAALAALFSIAPLAAEAQDERGSYFKFNLDYINLYDLIRFEDSGARQAEYRQGYNLIRNATKGHGNAWFNMIDRALNGPDPQRDAETAALLNAWLQRPRRDFFVDLRGQFPSCQSADQACDPIPVQKRVPTDFLWQRSPFQLTGGGAGLIEGAGVDYILPYWMARYYRVPGV